MKLRQIEISSKLVKKSNLPSHFLQIYVSLISHYKITHKYRNIIIDGGRMNKYLRMSNSFPSAHVLKLYILRPFSCKLSIIE